MTNLLFQAVKNNDLDRTRFLIESGYDILEKDVCGWTVLQYASYEGNLEIVKFLIEVHVAINADKLEKDNYGWLALDIASQCNHIEIVKFLLSVGFNIHSFQVPF